MPAEIMESMQEVDSMVTALEEAVYKGNVDQARQMAEGLAKFQAKLSIKLIAVGPPVQAATFRLDVVIESPAAPDKFIAPIPIQVSPGITIYGLKVKMALLYGIPIQCQRWIIGKKIPRDEETLKKLNVKHPAKVFLYVLEAKTIGLNRGEVSAEEENLKKFHDELLCKGNNPDLALTPQEYNRYLEARRQNQRPNPRTIPPEGYNTWSRGSRPRGPPRQPVTAWDGHHSEDGYHGDEGIPSRTDSMRDVPYERDDSLYSSSGFGSPDSPRGPPPDQFGPSRGQRFQQRANHYDDRANHYDDRRPPHDFPQPPVAMERRAPPPAHQAPIIPPEPPKLTARDVGWSCKTCTFRNPPLIPACRTCLGARPEDYKPPAPGTYIMDPGEERTYLEQQQNEMLLKKWEEEEKVKQHTQAQENLAVMMQAAEQNIVTNTEPFDCPVCFSEIEPGEGVKLRECLHELCRDCLENHINICNEPEVKCPYTDGEHDCEQVIPDREIKQIISEEDYNRYLQRGLNRAEAAAADAFHCKSPDCVGLCFYEDEVNFFDCEVCKKQNCLTCKAIHEGQNCKQYQEELKIKAGNDEAAKKTHEALQQMLKDGEAMNCPKCGIIIQKKSGCDWMQCSVCKVEICWVTKGPRWGPKGRGDNSGGCKCRYAATGGAKCHPQCGNCH